MDQSVQNPIDVEKHGALLTSIISDPEDRQFIYQVKRAFEMLSEKDKEYIDVSETLRVLKEVISQNIMDKKEVAYYMSDANFTDQLKAFVDYNSKYSKAFKEKLLQSLMSKTVVSNVQPILTKAQELIDTIDLQAGKKAAVDATNTLYTTLNELQRTAWNTKVSGRKGDLIIIDPIDNDTYNTIPKVMEEYRRIEANKIKTIPVFDNLFGGGLKAGTVTLFCGRNGSYKSGLEHITRVPSVVIC